VSDKGRIYIPNQNMPRICPDLAEEIGLNESILLLQLDYWLSVAGKERDDREWVYESLSDIQTAFPFWSRATINRAIHSLEDAGLITTTDKYNRRKGDKTRWFALNYAVIAALSSVLVTGIEVSQNDTPVSKRDGVSQNETGVSQNETGVSQNETTLPHDLPHDLPHESPDKNVGADAPVSAPTPDNDLDPKELFTPSDHKDNGKQHTPRFHLTNDAVVGIVQASDLAKERGIPDWAIPGPEGPDPAFRVVNAFCELTGQSVDTLSEKRGKVLLRHYAKLSQEHDLTLEHMAQAHDVLRGENWGKWHLDHHKWSTGFEDKYIDQLVLAAGQIRDGRLKSNGDGEIVEDVPDEILAQGRGYAAIMAHQRLKDKAARERGESVPESMWPSIRELEARERESQEEGQ